MTCSQQLDSVSNEGLLVLVTHVYKNKRWKLLKNFCQFVQKQRRERKEDLKSSMEIAKLFALHPTAKKKPRMAIGNIFALSENAKN